MFITICSQVIFFSSAGEKAINNDIINLLTNHRGVEICTFYIK